MPRDSIAADTVVAVDFLNNEEIFNTGKRPACVKTARASLTSGKEASESRHKDDRTFAHSNHLQIVLYLIVLSSHSIAFSNSLNGKSFNGCCSTIACDSLRRRCSDNDDLPEPL